ncbi:hypothetical protein MRX96_050363 [Rhipicephalus microplus]
MGDGIEMLQCPAIRRGDLSRVHSADLKLPALRQLVNCQHLESFCISIDSDHMRLSLALADYLRSTTTLRGLELDIRCNAQEETHGRKLWWNAILQAISQSKSVNRLDLTMSGLNIQDSQDLATSVKCSTYIRELAIVNTPKAYNTAFLRCLSEDIQENYTLASVKLVGGIGAHAFSHWLTVKETTWRNLGFVARAARMIEASDSDRYVTSAVEHIARYPALMDEVAETAQLDLAELGVLERVVCDPAEDGCMRLDDLNEDCWLHVRRYLVTDDVKYDALQVGTYHSGGFRMRVPRRGNADDDSLPVGIGCSTAGEPDPVLLSPAFPLSVPDDASRGGSGGRTWGVWSSLESFNSDEVA